MSGNSQNSAYKLDLSNKAKLGIALLLIALGILSRLMPHPPNFAPIAAIALFGGAYLPRKTALILPLIALAVSDLFLGLHGLVFWTWGSFMAISLFSTYVLKKQVNPTRVLASSIGASVFFYLVTNFGVWLEGLLYPKTIAGLASSYINALPFFRNTLLGDLFYSSALFAAYELALYYGRQFKTARNQ